MNLALFTAGSDQGSAVAAQVGPRARVKLIELAQAEAECQARRPCG
ncbi:hypothetical protein LUTEI9C_80341 [Luteimonas sp. 9C]|nr:hypothetical protein LUTEI9C_80341 [Luteimonas sp. 9C]